MAFWCMGPFNRILREKYQRASLRHALGINDIQLGTSFGFILALRLFQFKNMGNYINE